MLAGIADLVTDLEFGVGFQRSDEWRWSVDLRRPEVPVGVDEPEPVDRPEIARRAEPALALNRPVFCISS